MNKRPFGKLTVMSCKLMRPNNNVAVYVRVYVRDENDDIFYLNASSFRFDLKSDTNEQLIKSK